jgi:septum formation protein
MEIILASSSPRRKQLLEQVGFRVQVIPSYLAEEKPKGTDYITHVRNMANKKAQKVAGAYPNCLVLGADTLVVCGDEAMGKPSDAEDAFAMLQKLSGREHQVITGFCLLKSSTGLEIIDHAVSEVRFYPLTAQEIEDYLQSGEPFDKAGAYGIQGLGAKFVHEVHGCFYNIVGLPLGMVWQYMKALTGG